MTSCPLRPRLPTFTHVVPAGPDRVQLRAGGRRTRMSGPGVADMAVAILGACDGRTTTAELPERLGLEPARVEAFLAECYRHRVVLDAADEDQWPEVAANPALVEALVALDQPAGQIQWRLAAAAVGVAGQGPVATMVAAHLVAAGVGDVIPGDDVATVAGAGRRLDVAVVDAHRIRPADEPVLAQLTHLPYTLGTAETAVGPVVVPGRAPCSACATARRLSHSRAYEDDVAFARAVRTGSIDPADPPVLEPYAAIVAGAVAIETLRLVGGFGVAQTAGGVLVADAVDLSLRRQAVLPVPGCRCDEAEARR